MSSSSIRAAARGGPRAGDTLGRYQLLVAVGEGGMGRVWAARQVGSPLQRLVAVKTAISGLSQTPEFQRLFMDEARIASLIHHPHVCGVYELGEEKGTLYLVMEWCDGASLRQVMDGLKDERMSMAVGARIVANVAAGLHAAHELEDSDGTQLRVVHRDVSPQNILISKSGHIKVADFGVAKAQGQLHRPTETGEMKGKLSYMAPEQVTAKDIDQRADIFALGCVLYEVTVGRRPFQGEGALSTLYQLLEQAVTPPGDVVEGYPPELSAIVLKALAKDVDERFSTAEDFRVALESWIAGCGSKATEREIAVLLKQATGELIDNKSASINQAINTLKAQPERLSHRPRRESRRPASPSASPPRQREGSSTVDRAIATGNISEKSSSWLLPVGAGALVLALAVVLAKGSLGGAAPPDVGRSAAVEAPRAPAVDAPAVVAPPPSPPAAAELVKVTVTTVPEGATLRIDRGSPMLAPYSAELAPNERVRVIRASAKGYVSQTREVAFDRSLELVMELQRAVPKARVSRPAAPVAPQATPPAEPVKVPAPVPPGKRPRTLDSDNPFSSG